MGVFSDTWDALEQRVEQGVANAELGLAGAKDLVEHALGIDSHAAADLYAQQEAERKQLAPAAQAAVQQEARAAEDGGALLTAAADTVTEIAPGGIAGEVAGDVTSQVLDAAKKKLDEFTIPWWVKFVLVGGVGLGVTYAGYRLVRAARAAGAAALP